MKTFLTILALFAVIAIIALIKVTQIKTLMNTKAVPPPEAESPLVESV